MKTQDMVPNFPNSDAYKLRETHDEIKAKSIISMKRIYDVDTDRQLIELESNNGEKHTFCIPYRVIDKFIKDNS